MRVFFVYHFYTLTYHSCSFPSPSRTLAYGLCFTARPLETLTALKQRPKQSSLHWGFFTTIVSTPTLRYQGYCCLFSMYFCCFYSPGCSRSCLFEQRLKLVNNSLLIFLVQAQKREHAHIYTEVGSTIVVCCVT